jgi:hypothetical protein
VCVTVSGLHEVEKPDPEFREMANDHVFVAPGIWPIKAADPRPFRDKRGSDDVTALTDFAGVPAVFALNALGFGAVLVVFLLWRPPVRPAPTVPR